MRPQNPKARITENINEILSKIDVMKNRTETDEVLVLNMSF